MKRWLDSSLELLILLARVLSVAGGLSVVVLGMAIAVLGEFMPLLGVLVQAMLWTALFGWFGWWLYGNEEWRRREKAE